MKKIVAFLLGVVITHAAFSQTFTLKSSSLGGQFTNEISANTFGCTGNNSSPELTWTNAPVGTKSFAVTMYDVDAPTGSGFWHWVIVNIPAGVTELKEGAGDAKVSIAPSGSLQSINDAGFPGYIGPCPPQGDAAHKYIITVYALKTAALGTAESSSGALVGFMLNQQVLAKASIIAYYKR
jgi:Raf kinase inhibitor-like YbhB/YbcL family protein